MAKKMIKLSLLVTLVCVMALSILNTASASVAPVINYFDASSTNIKPGETVRLDWNVSGADNIELIGLEKSSESNIDPSGSIEVWPTTSTTYVLIAYGDNNSMASKVITVNVNGSNQRNVRINYFDASDYNIRAGDSVTLSFSLENAESYEIIGLEKTKEGNQSQDSFEIWPTDTTTYLLRAYGYNGDTVSSSLIVTVDAQDDVQINDFYINPDSINEG